MTWEISSKRAGQGKMIHLRRVILEGEGGKKKTQAFFQTELLTSIETQKIKNFWHLTCCSNIDQPVE